MNRESRPTIFPPQVCTNIFAGQRPVPGTGPASPQAHPQLGAHPVACRPRRRPGYPQALWIGRFHGWPGRIASPALSVGVAPPPGTVGGRF